MKITTTVAREIKQGEILLKLGEGTIKGIIHEFTRTKKHEEAGSKVIIIGELTTKETGCICGCIRDEVVIRVDEIEVIEKGESIWS